MANLRFRPSETPLRAEYETIADALERVPHVDVAFDASTYDARTVARVGAEWSLRAVAEHRSSAVFTQLAVQLLEANATIDAQVVALRMAQDELRHAATCADVVSALGGTTEAKVDLTVEPLALHAGVSVEERAVRNVLYTTCCCELVACARFVAMLDSMTDPFLRHAVRRLLADEVLHGQFGFHYLESQRGWLATRHDVRASLGRYLRHAFAVLEEAVAPPAHTRPATADETALGVEHSAVVRDVFETTMAHAVVPGLMRFDIDAQDAWRRRARAR